MSAQTTHSDLTAFTIPLQNAAWRDVSTTYLIGEKDLCLPTHIQENWVCLVAERVKVARLPSGHMLMLSMPEKFTKFLVKETGEVMKHRL